jgi:hypothetical protein
LHDARVSVAAGVANAYVNFRFCEIQVELARNDGVSRAARSAKSTSKDWWRSRAPMNPGCERGCGDRRNFVGSYRVSYLCTA